MGKLKNRHRNKKSKPFPNGNGTDQNGSSSQVAEEEDEFSRVMSDIVAKLESPSVMEKLSALLLLAEMVDMKQIRSIIIDHEICKIVGPLLVDPDIQLSLNAAGAIRNLTSCGEEEVLEALVEQDVLTPVLTLLSNLARTLQKPNSVDSSMEVDSKPTKKGAKAQLTEWEEKIDLACQVVNTLWNLCESCGTVLKYVNNEEVIRVFIKFLDKDKYDISLSIEAAQFIHMLSEDNTFVIKYLIQHEALFDTGFKATQNIDPDNLNGSAILLQVLYAGILQNITPNFFTRDPDTFKILSRILSTNQRSVLNLFTSDLPKASDRNGKERIESVAHFISAQKLVLEFITNLCSSDEDEDPETVSHGCGGMDVDISDGEENSASAADERVKLSPELHERFVEVDIFRVVLEKVDLPAVNVCQILRGEDDYKHLMKKLIKLQCTGFLCINNLVSCMEIPPETLFTQFVAILSQHYTDNLTTEQCEALTCALRSLLLSLNEAIISNNSSSLSSLIQDPSILKTISARVNTLSADPVSIISNLLIDKLSSEQSKGGRSVEVEMNLMKVIALWMSLLLKLNQTRNEDITLIISKFFHLLDTTDHLILLAETLDCLIDMFSEDDTDTLAKQLNLIGKLTATEPRLKNMIKFNKKTLESEKLALVSTVQTNLHAFIQYKRERVANIKSQ